ncbi:BTAD domain-containing putative transcriptional regulator [Polymorphospora rubra]|uniref:AfsR/SARP family transcriptional regulator n=1 Tax=Polymorphospora rubra TaxID=338584 RepID=UPI0033D436D3
MHTSRGPLSGRLEIRLLGPVEISDGDTWRGIGSAKQRALLVMLALKANQVVSLDQLVTELWDENPPASATSLVAGYAWRLRRALGDRAGRILTTRSPGYRLVAPPEALDIHEFERLISRAHADLAAGQPAAAADGFGTALGLWRGAPLADVRPTPMVVAEIARLEETRIAAVEARIGAELDLGRHAMLLPTLKVLVAEHPLRERLHAHLMTALYRDGQQAVALGAYRDLRRLLVDELGIEPSDKLRDLVQRMLRNDPSLRTPAPPVTLPRQRSVSTHRQPRFPAAPTKLFGRAGQLDQLVDAVRAGRLGLVHGHAGAGKTALAIQAAHRLAGGYPDGPVFVPMGASTPAGPAETDDVLRTTAAALGVPAPPAGTAPAAGWRSLLAGRRALVVFDDVGTAGQIRALGPLPPGCGYIATTRSGLTTLDGTTRVLVGALGRDEAVDMLRAHLGADRVDAERHAAAVLIGRCDHLPVAVRVAAARLAPRPNWTIESFTARLADPATRLDVLVCETMSVRECLAGGVRLLARRGDQLALRALRQLGPLDRQLVTVTGLAALLHQPAFTAEVTVEHLVDAGLAEALADGRYRFSGLVRAFAREPDRWPETDDLTEPDRVPHPGR